MSVSLFRIPGPWSHAILADQKRELPSLDELASKFKETDVPDEFIRNLIQAITSWSTHALDHLAEEHKQTALCYMKIIPTSFGVMNRLTSPAVRNGVLPVVVLDFLLHAVDPQHVAPLEPRLWYRPFSSTKHKNHFLRNTDWYQILHNAWIAHTERKAILKRPTLDVETIAEGPKKRCLGALTVLNNNSKPGDTAMYNMTQAAFMLRGLKEGKMIMTFDAFIDLALLQARQEDPSITRTEVANVLNDPNVDGICAALAVAAAISPVLLLSTQNYANGAYNPSTSIFDYWFAGGNSGRVRLEEPLGQVERVCWTALLRLAAQTVSAAEAIQSIFESEEVLHILRNKPPSEKCKNLDFGSDHGTYEIEEADPEDAYEQEIARRLQEEKEDEEKKKQEAEAEREREAMKKKMEVEAAERERQKEEAEREKAEKEKEAKEKKEKEKEERKRQAEEQKKNSQDQSEPRKTRSQSNKLPVKANTVEVSAPAQNRPRKYERGRVRTKSGRASNNAYIRVLDEVLDDVKEHVALRDLKPLNFDNSRPMEPEPLVIDLYAPEAQRGCSHKRTFEYCMFKKFAIDREMIESMLQSQPTARPLFLEDSARDPDPRLQASEKQSIFYVCTEAEYEELPDDVKYEIHRHRCVLMLDVHGPKTPPPFDWNALKQFRDPDELCPIQDMGLEGRKGSQCLVKGSLSALLPQQGRPVLNAVHHPLSHRQLSLPPGLSYFCSLAEALTFLENHPHLPKVPSPWGDRRWGLVATALARSPTHQDIAATEMSILTGCKMVAIGVPRADKFGTTNYKADPGSRFSFMNWEDVQVDAQVDVYRWEVFLLEPKMAFYMRAGTPHFIISLEDTVASGLHSINGAQIQPAIFTVLHNFVTEGYHANAEHRVIQWLLVRMFIFWAEIIQRERPEMPMHYPSLGTAQGLLDLLTLHSYVVLYPALLLEPYQNMPPTSGLFGTACYMTADRYEEYDFALYAGDCLVNMACCLTRYRTAWIQSVKEKGDDVTEGFTVTALKQQLRRALAAYEYCSTNAAGPLSKFSPQVIHLEEGHLTTAFDAELNEDVQTPTHTHFMPWDLQSRPMPFSLKPVAARAEARPANAKRPATEDDTLSSRKRQRPLNP
ncbi:hypothetical protein R3P38DRAFT_3216788 [Favolaschia claudopus]|uniref:Uncharacterized protein n=1 Tax=Favolaschia claudopus TaxID=2862362 RepID=A0AAV9ZMR3_9AGAR